MTAFFSCFEAGWFEGFCTGGDSKATKCLESTGIDQSKYSKCKSDSALLQQLHAEFSKIGKDKNIKLFPTCRIDGNDASDAQDPKSLKKALCDAGVQASCGSGPSPPVPPPSPPVPPSPPSPPSPPPSPSPPAPPQP